MPRVHQGWGNSGKNRGTMVVEYDTHHPPAPWASSWLHSGDKNSLPYQNNLLQGISNINFIFMGEPKFASSWSFFSVLVGLAPVAPLLPDGFVLVRWEGGLCGGFCTTVLRRAFWQGDKVIQFSYRKFPSSGTITRCISVHSHVRTHSHSLSALSLYIFIIFRSVHSIISHIFSGIV